MIEETSTSKDIIIVVVVIIKIQIKSFNSPRLYGSCFLEVDFKPNLFEVVCYYV